MQVKFFDIQNFRKLKNCRLELSNKETVFVGANNSGKTSAMDMLICFLVKSKRKMITTTDFTLSNWTTINKFAASWIFEEETMGSSIQEWQDQSPTLDVWLKVNNDELHYINHLIPTLSWSGGLLGVRLCFEPIKIEDLKKNYIEAYKAAQSTIKDLSTKRQSALSLWPKSMRDFLDKKIHNYFKINAYLLDPSKLNNITNSDIKPQQLHIESCILDIDPFDGLFRIDLIEAQRGFADANAANYESSSILTAQLRKYYEKHLDPTDMPELDDLEALEAIEYAQSTFDKKLKERFEPAIKEIEELGYPGFTDPTISLTCRVNPLDTLNHDAAIQFDVSKSKSKENDESFLLPEKLNGLGYKNLISIIFALISFRSAWMREGKAGSKNSKAIEPLHIVLLEEPEAHLHTQVQQVFINKAYDVLRNHTNLKSNNYFSTQLIISTHSSYLAREVDFSKLRYFNRKSSQSINEIPSATIVNLSDTFGNKNDETTKFVTRYLKTTHCDLFFANAIILIEGTAERILLPHFIRKDYKNLSNAYISILEINGAHAHTLRSLLEKLKLYTLIITDLDSIEKNGKKILPAKNASQKTNNSTLKTWIPELEDLDSLLSPNVIKVKDTIRVAYQYEIDSNLGDNDTTWKAIPYTFEDALVLSNIQTFKEISKSTGMLKKMVDALKNNTDIETIRSQLFEALNGEKAKMALDLLFNIDPTTLTMPFYIKEGLEWLEDMLTSNIETN